MSKRERILAIAIAGLILLFGLDYFVIEPTLAYFRNVSAEIETAEERLRSATLLVENRQIIEERWGTYETAGVGNTESTLRYTVQQGLATWARQARFDLTTVASSRTVAGENFNEVQFVATGSGPIAAVIGFMDRVHTSEFPLRIESMEITSRSEKADSLTLRVTVSTINERQATSRVAMRSEAGQ